MVASLSLITADGSGAAAGLLAGHWISTRSGVVCRFGFRDAGVLPFTFARAFYIVRLQIPCFAPSATSAVNPGSLVDPPFAPGVGLNDRATVARSFFAP